MKSRPTFILLGVILISGIVPAPAKEIEIPLAFDRRNMSDPRLGMTFVSGDGELYQSLERQDIGRVVSQFGWHCERHVIPDSGGPRFVIQFVPMIAGVEYGKFVPGATLAMGIRMPRGWEFDTMPDIVATKEEFDAAKARTSLVLASGKSLNYGEVIIPLNLAMSTAREGNQFSLLFGYAIGKTTRTVEVPDDDLEELHGSVSTNKWDGLR